ALPRVSEAGRVMPRAASASTADGNLPGGHTLAEIGLRDPACVEDVLEVVLRDRVRRQQDRAQAVPTRGLERGCPLDLARIRVVAELHRGLARGLSEQARVLPYVDRLCPECDAVDGGLVTVLAGHRHLTRESLGPERAAHPPSPALCPRLPALDRPRI